jgi:hypothetical protein
MTEYDALKESVMDLVITSKNQRLRPIDATQAITRQLGVSRFAVNSAVRDLVWEQVDLRR